MRRLLGMLVVVLGLSWLLAPTASACSCEPLSLDEAADAADVVAHVRAVEVNADDDATHIFGEVLRSWKGDTPPQIHIVSPAVGGDDCGVTPPAEGSQMLIFAEDQHLSYRVDVCSGTREYTAEDADIDRLNELLGNPVIRGPVDAPAQDVREEDDDAGFSWWLTGLSAGFLLVMGILIYRYEQGHKRRRRQ